MNCVFCRVSGISWLLFFVTNFTIFYLCSCSNYEPVEPHSFSVEALIKVPSCPPDSSTSIGGVTIPEKYDLLGICWNDKFKRIMTIKFELPRTSKVKISVIKKLLDGTMGVGNYFISWDGGDYTGKEILIQKLVDGFMEAGHHSVMWDNTGKKAEGGIYGIVMKAGGYEEVLWFAIGEN